MVSKKTTAETKTTVKSATVKKSTAKTAAKKPVEKKPVAKKASAVNAQVPVKKDVNPVEEVLEIKAKNEQKKAVKAGKASPKKAKVNASGVVVEPLQVQKVVLSGDKRAVKNNAEKSNARKFAEIKASVFNEGKSCCCESCKNGMWAAWWRAFQNIFNYKGRTSRYEFWAFMLINLLVSVLAVILATVLGAVVQSFIGTVTFVTIFTLIETLACLSLIVRRIHDTGRTAWSGFYRPFVWHFVSFVFFSIASVFIAVAFEREGIDYYGIFAISTAIVSGLIILWSFLGIIYYSTKIGIVSSYYESDGIDNAYGAVRYNSSEYNAKGLKYTVMFCTIVSFIYMLASAASEAAQNPQIAATATGLM